LIVGAVVMGWAAASSPTVTVSLVSLAVAFS